jgi:biotin-(acetyl-CoA carboxylase) ligase
MRVLTDAPHEAIELLAARVRYWPIRQLESHHRAIWRILAPPSGDLFVGETADIGGFWRRLVLVREARRSQFDALVKALHLEIEPHEPTVSIALSEHNCRGQLDRRCEHGAGNLFLSAFVVPRAPAAEIAPVLVMLPAVATVDAIAEAGGEARIKWVNDLLIGGSKVGGVRAASCCRTALLEWAVLGVGVNVAVTPEVEPTAFVPTTTSLRESGVQVGLFELTRWLLAALAARYRELMERGPANLLAAYRRASCVVGREVGLWPEDTDLKGDPATWPDPLHRGVVRTINPDLSLSLDTEDEPITRGRLALLD